jgi:hypothetical protein
MRGCWSCGGEIDVAEDFYGDITCEHCFTMNSFYNPADYVPEAPDGAERREEMRPEKKKVDFEKVAIGEMLTGIIEQCQYDREHVFKGFQGKEDTVGTAIRLKLKLDGYNWPHYSRWMRLSTSEKSNLYKKYVVKLVEGAMPDIDIDLDILNGMQIKVIFTEENDYQNIDTIYPKAAKVKPDAPIADTTWMDEETAPADDDVLPPEGV